MPRQRPVPGRPLRAERVPQRRRRVEPAVHADPDPVQRAETLTEQAYRAIEERIVTLRLKPGDILSEQLLSATIRDRPHP